MNNNTLAPNFTTPQKIMITILSTLVVVFVLFGTSVFSIAGTAIDSTREGVSRSLGEEFRINQAAYELESSKKSLKVQRTRVSKFRVSCDDIRSEISQRRNRLAKLRRVFDSIDDAWARSSHGSNAVTYNGVSLKGADMRRLLERSASEVDAARTQLASRENLLKVRLDALLKAESMLSKYERRFDRVEMAIESSRFDLESVRLMQESSTSELDRTALTEAESLVIEVSEDLRILRELENINSRSEFIEDHAQGPVGDVVERVRTQSENSWK